MHAERRRLRGGLSSVTAWSACPDRCSRPRTLARRTCYIVHACACARTGVRSCSLYAPAHGVSRTFSPGRAARLTTATAGLRKVSFLNCHVHYTHATRREVLKRSRPILGTRSRGILLYSSPCQRPWPLHGQRLVIRQPDPRHVESPVAISQCEFLKRCESCYQPMSHRTRA